ncbi:MAG: hypothetical protein ABI995_13585, partial [Acidobacteriota bacterium]
VHGSGYSPFYGVVIYSPQSYYAQRNASTYSSPSGTSDASRGAVAAPAYSGSSAAASVGTVVAPAASAPAASTPNTGGGGDAGRRR